MAKIFNNTGTKENAWCGDIVSYRETLCMVAMDDGHVALIDLSDGLIMETYSSVFDMQIDDDVLFICKAENVHITLNK